MPDAPPPQACFESDAGLDSLSQVNMGCQNGDLAGYDPILLSTRSAATEPFTDFAVAPLRTLAVTRSYTSGDVMAGGAAGIFGLGWHHNWETTLACWWDGASHVCSVTTGLGGRMAFKARSTTVVGAGALRNEELVLYERVEAENLAYGGHNLMVRRPSGEFILFQLDGSELSFTPPISCGGTYCMDESFIGTLRLTREIDPVGRSVRLDFTAASKLLTVTDDLGNQLSLLPSGPCSSRAGSLRYRAGSGGDEVEYVTYTYDGTCSLLERVVPAVGHSAAPGKPSQLRYYEYQSSPKPRLLTKVRNEHDDAIVEFGYDPTSGRATSLQDSQSSLTIGYPQGNQDVVVNSYGDLQATATSWRDDSGKASTVLLQPGYERSYEEILAVSEEKMTWSGRYLVCSEAMRQYVRHFARDEHNRATTIADYGDQKFADSSMITCAEEPWLTKAPLRSTSFEYGLTRTIAEGVVLPLHAVTRTSRTSVFGDALAAAAGGGKTAADFKTSESLDYDPAEDKAGDPSGYRCGTAGLPVGGLVCRRYVEGFTKDADGANTLQRIGTFFSYDGRGRLVRTEGPIYLVGSPPDGNVDPVEERTYWPDDDGDLLRRGRLHEIKRWPSGYPSGASALVTTIELYDVFGPSRVVDEAGGTTVYTRAGGAGRVTRVDTPDGRHVSSRYYDGEQPRLVLLNSGSARRFTYDQRGRLHVTEPLSGDPEQDDAVTVGWTETREHDVAGNMTLLTLVDQDGVLRGKQAFEHYPSGQVRKMPHPDGKGGYARWTRNPAGVLELQWDEDRHVTRTRSDALRRPRQVTFEYWDSYWNRLLALPGGFAYEYEPGQDAISKVSSLTGSAGAPNGVDPVIAEYVHDDFGNLLSVGSPHTMTAGPYLYRYDARGNVVKRSGGGATITYWYDGLDRLTQLTATRSADSSSFTYVYGYDEPPARGRLRTITEPDRTTTFTFDEVGRTLTEVVAEHGISTPLTTEYGYDSDGDLLDVTTPAGLRVRYERDPVTKDVVEVRNFVTNTKYATDVKHRPSGPISNLTFAGGATLSQGFNLRYEPDAIQSGEMPSTQTALKLSYTVSSSGLMTTIGNQTFTYDKRDRLESATPLLTTPYTFIYPQDAGTNWFAVNDRPSEAQEPTGKRVYAFGYDDGSNMSAISKYDAAGATLTGTTCLVHDALGRLTAVGPAKVTADPTKTVCRSESDLATVTVRFRYDARNRRVGRQDGADPWKQYVFTSGGDLIAEMTQPGTSGGDWSAQREYVWIDGRPLAQVEYPGPSGDEGYVYLFHVDHLGQPRALTTRANEVVWSASPPRPYGDLEEATTPDPANDRTIVTNLRLPGQYDERLFQNVGVNMKGPFYNWHRWYLPSMGRYMELDPIAVRGGLNGSYRPDWYGYADANPTRFGDPLGLLTEVIIWGNLGWDPAAIKSIMGHVSVNINGTSWSVTDKNGMRVRPLADYLKEIPGRRGHGIILNLTSTQEEELAAYLDAEPPGAYTKYGHNCGAPIQQGLQHLGFRLRDFAIRPNTLFEYLMASPLAIGETSYGHW